MKRFIGFYLVTFKRVCTGDYKLYRRYAYGLNQEDVIKRSISDLQAAGIDDFYCMSAKAHHFEEGEI